MKRAIPSPPSQWLILLPRSLPCGEKTVATLPAASSPCPQRGAQTFEIKRLVTKHITDGIVVSQIECIGRGLDAHILGLIILDTDRVEIADHIHFPGCSERIPGG